MKKSSFFYKSVLTAVFLAMVTGFSGCRKNQNSTKVSMACNPFVGMAPFYVAMDKGFFKEQGIDLTKVDFDDSSNSCSALMTGNVDFSYATLDSAIIAASQNNTIPVKVFSVVDESYGADGILAKNDISLISDLKGKKCGVAVNQTSHYLLMKALETAGLTDSDLELTNMTSSDAGVAFITGSLDAAVTWEPYLSNAVSSGAGKIIFSSVDAPGSIVDILITRPECLNASWMPGIKTAYDKGISFIRDPATKAEAVKITAKYLEVDEEEAQSMMDTVKLYTFKEAEALLSKENTAYRAVGNISDFYFSKKIISRTVSPDQIIAE